MASRKRGEGGFGMSRGCPIGWPRCDRSGSWCWGGGWRTLSRRARGAGWLRRPGGCWWSMGWGRWLLGPALLWLWLVPVLLGQPALRLYLLAEHGDCPKVANMFENTRTTFTTGLVRLLAWNMPYHVEHHVMPMVPFHRLPELHGVMRDRLRVTAEGYVAFTKSLSGAALVKPGARRRDVSAGICGGLPRRWPGAFRSAPVRPSRPCGRRGRSGWRGARAGHRPVS